MMCFFGDENGLREGVGMAKVPKIFLCKFVKLIFYKRNNKYLLYLQEFLPPYTGAFAFRSK